MADEMDCFVSDDLQQQCAQPFKTRKKKVTIQRVGIRSAAGNRKPLPIVGKLGQLVCAHNSALASLGDCAWPEQAWAFQPIR